MASALMNPNQCQAFGIGFCDDPTNLHRPLGFEDPSTELFVEMKMDGMTACFDYQVPTNDEMLKLPRLHLTLECEWDPCDVNCANRLQWMKANVQ